MADKENNPHILPFIQVQNKQTNLYGFAMFVKCVCGRQCCRKGLKYIFSDFKSRLYSAGGRRCLNQVRVMEVITEY